MSRAQHEGFYTLMSRDWDFPCSVLSEHLSGGSDEGELHVLTRALCHRQVQGLQASSFRLQGSSRGGGITFRGWRCEIARRRADLSLDTQ